MKQSKIIRKVIQLLLISMMAVCIYGQNQKTNITKEEIIKNSWKAMFGELGNSDIKSIYLESYFHGSKVPNKITIRRPNLFRNEFTEATLVFDGKRALEIKNGKDENGNTYKPSVLKSNHWKHFEVDIALAFPAFFDYPSEYKGSKNVNGVDTYSLFVQLPLGGHVTYFVDAENFLIVRRLVSWEGNPEHKLWENLIDKYIEYEGKLYPDGYSFNGRDGKEKGYYKNIKFNVNTEDDFFKIPEGL